MKEEWRNGGRAEERKQEVQERTEMAKLRNNVETEMKERKLKKREEKEDEVRRRRK